MEMDSEVIEEKPNLLQNFQNVCRLCMSEEMLEDVFIFHQDDLIRRVFDLLSIALSEDDQISRSICAICRARLNEFHEYKLSCLQIQGILQGQAGLAGPIEQPYPSYEQILPDNPNVDEHLLEDIKVPPEIMQLNAGFSGTDHIERPAKKLCVGQTADLSAGPEQYAYEYRVLEESQESCSKTVSQSRLQDHVNKPQGENGILCLLPVTQEEFPESFDQLDYDASDSTVTLPPDLDDKSALQISENICDGSIRGEAITTGATGEPLSIVSHGSTVSAQTSETLSICNTFDSNTLLELLEQTDEGKDIIKRAYTSELSEAKQLQLAGIIAQYHLIHRPKLHTEHLQMYALAICTLFKFERQDNYYIGRGGDRKNHGGKIANKVVNLRKKKRKADASEEQHALGIQWGTPPHKTVDHYDEKSIQAYEWLVLNTHPWTIVLDKWLLCLPIRKPLFNHSALPKVLKHFPHYKDQNGYQLIDSDFKQLFREKSNNLHALEEIRPAVTAFIAKRAVDSSAENILKLLTETSTSEDTKHCALLLGLSTVLTPIPAGIYFKPTIGNSQEDTIIFAESEVDAFSKVQHTYRTYINRKLPVVPKLVVLGKDVNNISGRFFVYFEDFHYELPTVARAVDILVKTTALFGLPYSRISKLVWHFISSEAYGIAERESYSSIHKLKNYLRSNSKRDQ